MGESSNEYKFYCALKSAINQWGKNHIVFFGYLRGKVDIDYAKSLYGTSDREFHRITNLQRKKLIEFIAEQEKTLGEIYPFIPVNE